LARVREQLLPLLFDAVPAGQLRRLARLYGLYWAPEPDAASALLRDMASACARDPEAIHAASVLRGEAWRVLNVYAQGGCLRPGQLDGLLADSLLRDFLAPLGQRLAAFGAAASVL
jgi:hypothetical protein